MSYAIEDLAPGMSASFAKTVSEADVAAFGAISGDTNPVHFDETFARTTPFKGRIAHGVLTASYISTVLGMEMPGPGTIFLGVNIRFKAPVRIGDTVRATCTVREILRERRRVVFDCACRVGETVVLEGEATVMPPQKKV
ncbi:MAG TPA: MaoC family dehydratase [Rhizomicrobium sp.]|jgi:3-hydroxybutyryl-CoA dehydratase|nr:MaoC family dehydratase [Rhizomicrobium sp.]